MERSAIPLFGFLSYGIDINAYVVNEDGSISIWLQRRALTKSIDPGKLDSFVSGGYSIRETAIKESEEEAGLPEDLAKALLKPAGCGRYIFKIVLL